MRHLTKVANLLFNKCCRRIPFLSTDTTYHVLQQILQPQCWNDESLYVRGTHLQRLQPFRQNSIRLQRHSKLGRRYFGPYKVLGRVGEVAYKLELPDSAQIHPVFHVSLLKKCIGKPAQQVTPLDMVDSAVTMILQPAAILEKRLVQRSSHLVEQCLVQWEGLALSEATWEDTDHLLKLFPTLQLEDKLVLVGKGNVMTYEPNRAHT